jgi:hypothetical protein
VTRPLFSRDEKRLAWVVVATVAGGVLQHAVAVPHALLAGPLTVLEATSDVMAATIAPAITQVLPLLMLAWVVLASYGVWSVVR